MKLSDAQQKMKTKNIYNVLACSLTSISARDICVAKDRKSLQYCLYSYQPLGIGLIECNCHGSMVIETWAATPSVASVSAKDFGKCQLGRFFLFWTLSAAHLPRLPWYGLKKEERGAMYPVQRTGFCTGNSFDGAFVC